MILRLTFYIAITCALLSVTCGPAEAQAVAVFDFEWIDTSLEGATYGLRSDEQERLRRSSDQLRQRLVESGRFSLVDITPIATEARASSLQNCSGCDTRLAKRVGAELAITGTVQKVSNLILNMNIYIRDVSSGGTIAAMSADMRGNTDESWSRHPRMADSQSLARPRLRSAPMTSGWVHPGRKVFSNSRAYQIRSIDGSTLQ